MTPTNKTIQLLFSSWYYGLGGGETDLLSLAQDLDPARYRPHLLLPRPGPLGDRWREAGWPVHYLPFRGATRAFIPQIWARFPIVARMRELLAAQQIDIVHSDYHSLPMMAPAARMTDIPIMWTCHGWWFRPWLWQRDFFRGLPGVARSVAIRDGFLGRPPFMPAERLPVVYSGVDTQRFRPDLDGEHLRAELNIPPQTPLVAMIARFQDVKGHAPFQAMARQVTLQMPEARFIVAGEDIFGVGADAAYKKQILEQARIDPLLRERLQYIGFRDDAEQVIAAADVVVCASQFESYGKVNLEAMACARPVVSTKRGGPSETIVHGETGYLVEPGDIATMSRYVIELLRDPSLRARLGSNGRRRIERFFSAEASTRAYTHHFEKLLKDSS